MCSLRDEESVVCTTANGINNNFNFIFKIIISCNLNEEFSDEEHTKNVFENLIFVYKKKVFHVFMFTFYYNHLYAHTMVTYTFLFVSFWFVIIWHFQRHPQPNISFIYLNPRLYLCNSYFYILRTATHITISMYG